MPIRLQAKGHIKLKKLKTKYAFLDIRNGLRGRDVNLTLVWDVLPKVGYLHMHSHTVNIGNLPSEYM